MKYSAILLSLLFAIISVGYSQSYNSTEFSNNGTYPSPNIKSLNSSTFLRPDKDLTSWKEKPFYIPILEVPAINVLVNRFDVYVLQADWAKVSIDSWKKNLTQGLKSDGDNFSTNFFGHPFHGSLYYNSARSINKSFWESAAFTLGGSLMWEFFGETLPASEIDINTTVQGGMYLGELTHRLSKALLRNNTSRPHKFLRNSSALLLNPMGAINSVFYEDVSSAYKGEGVDNVLIRSQLSMGFGIPIIEFDRVDVTNSLYFSYFMLYGNIFDGQEGFKPFDSFILRSWIDIGTKNASKRFFLNIVSHAPWFKKIISDHSVFSISQHYDYIDNQAFKLGSTAITLDYTLKQDYKNWGFVGSLKIGIIPFGASSSNVIDALNLELSPDEISKEYVYGRGVLSKLEYMIYHNKLGRVTASFNNWYINTENYIQGQEHSFFLKVNYHYPISKTLRIGVERNIYRRYAAYKEFEGFENITEKYHEIKLLISKEF